MVLQMCVYTSHKINSISPGYRTKLSEMCDCFLAFLSHTAGLISIMNIENTKCHLTVDSVVQVKMQTQAESEIHGDTKTHTYTMLSLRKNVTNLSHYNCDKREPIFTISGRNVAISMPAVISPWRGTSSEKCLLVWHHFISKTVIIRMFLKPTDSILFK